jgi:hypothetical protein|tara:strand:- start:342 stop:635 length:294 start_codon:yes stop_codon:yes gene_type:complete
MNTLATLTAVIGLISTPVLAQETLKFAHVYEANTLYNEAAEWIADEIEKRTDGAYVVDGYCQVVGISLRSLVKAGSCHHFRGVISPEPKSIGAGVAV